MVPKVAGKGRSFKGAGLYYLHDKQALTSERVQFTHTVNLPTEDAEKALGWMAHTAMRDDEEFYRYHSGAPSPEIATSASLPQFSGFTSSAAP